MSHESCQWCHIWHGEVAQLCYKFGRKHGIYIRTWRYHFQYFFFQYGDAISMPYLHTFQASDLPSDT